MNLVETLCYKVTSPIKNLMNYFYATIIKLDISLFDNVRNKATSAV